MSAVANLLSFVGVVAFLGGFICIIWAIFGGPDWAVFWGIFGVPVFVSCVASADAISGKSEP